MDDDFDWSGFEHTRDACAPPKQLSDDEDEQKHVWVDSGSGPGYETLAPRPKLRPDRDKLS